MDMEVAKLTLRKVAGRMMMASVLLGFQITDAAENLDGESLYTEHCAMCHTAPQDERTPPRDALRSYTANSIFQALSEGIMRSQGEALTSAQRTALAEHLAGEAMRQETARQVQQCEQTMPALDLAQPSNWNGWGNGLSNPRHQESAGTRINAGNIGELELLWAYGHDNASAARAQQTVIGEVMFMGSPSGEVRAMDLATGCNYWTYTAPREVRTAITVAHADGQDGPLAVFADTANTLFVVDATTGEERWQADVDSHPLATSTGSPVVHDNRIYVPVSSGEVSAAGRPDYHCCTFRGNVAAFDLGSGERVWHTYVMEEATVVGENSLGNPFLAPSGAPIWQAPSLDPERGVVYAGTGQNYTRPASNSSDSVVAFDMVSGDIRWIHQTTPDDAFTMACALGASHPNCPDAGPDVDIGAPIVATTLSNGQSVVIAGTKGARVVALDPDAEGEVLWSIRVGRGGALGGIHWGMTFAGDTLYVPVSDRSGMSSDASNRMPGLHAIDMKTGDTIWYEAAPERCSESGGACMDVYSGPASALDDMVIATSLNGHLFAHDAQTGEVVWEYDTVRSYETINGVEAQGGAIDSSGPVISGDYLIVNSGYATFSQMPGNVVLVFRLPQ
ncbi:cytochrome CBB3 [Pseudohongiella nitratireducens]|uniref:Cytochrome CBB3 n=2 Tax=Pseudohongiella nitratireducens TaxID=1768907 RepID=A0A917LPY2_9GAMM|nr:cytochrome CBB3 [Pseudohongiella nitratireducens]